MTPPKKIILISLDTLRADHLGCYGYPRNTSPTLDMLAKEGILFKNTFSPASHTIPAHGSIFTGKYPSKHSIGFNQNIYVETGKLDTDIDITLAEILLSGGLNTAAFVSGIVLSKKTNLNAGFNSYDDDIGNNPYGRRDCSDTNQRIFNWLTENSKKDFFIFIHYFDIHGPYHCQQKYRELFSHDTHVKKFNLPHEHAGPNPQRNIIPTYQLLNIKTDQDNTIVDFETDLGYYISQYDGCVRYLDDNIGLLLTQLRNLGIYDDTLIIITSDHGEAFGENDIYLYHGLTVTRDQIYVPLIIKPHKSWSVDNREISIPVSSLDIMPTILDLCNFSHNELEIDGMSLVKIIEGMSDPAIEGRVIMSENERQYTLMYPNHIMELFMKETPSSTYYPYIPGLIESLNLKKMYWNSGKEYYYSMPFDQFQRYKLVSEIIDKYRIGERKFRILDVGAGFEENLKKFLPTDDIICLDKEYPPEYSHKQNFITGDIVRMEFKERYDFVVAVDVYEHIAPVDRKRFIDTTIPLSEIATIIAAPFDQEDVKRCETAANEVYRNSHGSDYIWLKEHSENGLPTLIDTLNFIDRHNRNYVIIPNGYLPRWFEMISIYLLTEGNAEFQPVIVTINELYNKFCYKYDNRNPAYRQTLVIMKEGYEREFSEIIVGENDSEELINLNQFLESFIDKIKMSAYRFSVSGVNQQIQYIHTLENLINEQDSQIALHSQKINNFQEIVFNQEKKIAELKEYLNNIQEKLVEREKQISEVTPYARHLENEISIKNRYIIEITDQYNKLKCDNRLMLQSMTFQLTSKFHRAIIERIFPQNSQRRKFYDRCLQFGRDLTNDGSKERSCVIKKYHIGRETPDFDITNQEKKETQETEKSLLDILKTESENELKKFLLKIDNRLIFPHNKKPVVSIIILTYNKSSYTYQCLQSILKFSDIPYEVILVDNGSTDNTAELLDRIDHCILIKSKINLGFIEGCNEGAKKSSGKYLLFLNNDTVVTEYWLSGLVRTIETYPQCGAVGCKLVWPNGQLQEAGSIVWNDGSASGFGRGDDPEKPEYSYLREIDYCSGACLLVRTDLFEKLKGFDERYIPAYYEDADLCLGIQNLGYKIIYQPKVRVFHHEFTSSSKEYAINNMKKNQTKFIEKWQEYLKTKDVNSPDALLDARDTRKGKKVLVIDDRIPASNQGSGYPRANVLLKCLGESGNKVTFFPIADTTQWQPYTSQFQDLGIEVLYGDHLNFEEFSQKRSSFYDVIIVSRPHNFERTYQIIKTYFPKAYLIYDAEALFSTRNILKAKIEGVPLDDNQIRDLREKEFELMRKADRIITVSENERELIQKKGYINNIVIFGHPVQVQKTSAEFTTRKDILFVGSFLAVNGPNDDAVLYFVKNIWPTVQKQISCKLYIVGINPPDIIKKLASESIIVTGFVPNLEEYYNTCRVFIVPHRYAAGIPLKLIEAMSYGIPSVVSELIGSQLNLYDGKEALVAKAPDEYIKKIELLYTNEELWMQIQQNAFNYIAAECKPEIMIDNLQKIFEDN